MTAEELSRVCFSLKPVLIAAGIISVVLVLAWVFGDERLWDIWRGRELRRGETTGRQF